MKTNKKISFFLIIFSILVSLVIVEVLLRLTGFKPWVYEKTESGNQEIFINDSDLGWISKKGTYELVIDNKLKSKVKIVIANEGDRFTGINNKNKQKIIFIGGSFTQGWGVNDSDTFAYLIQKKFNNFYAYNFAQSGYSGVQSLLLLKRKIKNIKSTKLIIYGFIEHHEQRNVARSGWLKTLQRSSKRGHKQTPKIPYASVNKLGELAYYKPVGYMTLPLREKFATVALIENFYMKQSSRHRKKTQKKVTKKIFYELNKITKKNNANFLVVNLNSSNRFNEQEYESFLKKNKINYANCNLVLDEDLMIPNDFHPNEKAHFLYSKCISDYIEKNSLLF